MKIYALLVGIDHYPISPLNQCVEDTLKFEAYLKEISTDYSTEVIIKRLHNNAAKKELIVDAVIDFLGQASNDDVALFYYSGHGAQEETKGRFIDEHDGLLECLVSYYETGQKSGFLLADKEIRYLFNKLPNNPHLVSVFDCCHSGDIVRETFDTPVTDQIKRLSGYFKARNYHEFIFNNEISEKAIKTSLLSETFPFKNHVHLAACNSSQSSWEDSQGGVFTRYLLQLLKANNNRLNYKDIIRWAKISLKEMTNKNQSPTISVQGEGKVNALSPWLKLHPDPKGRDQAFIIYNEKKGWHLTLGKLMGIKKGSVITIDEITDDQGKAIKLEVIEVDIESAVIEDPANKGIRLTKKQRYPVRLNTLFSSPNIFINNLDGNEHDKKKVESIIESFANINLSGAGRSDFYINIFNELVYISLPSDSFRPLARQIDLLDEESRLENVLEDQLKYLVKWHHFNSLENPDKDYDQSPIKVELKIDEENIWHDVTNEDFILNPKNTKFEKKDTKENFWIQSFQVKVTNISSETIYVGALSLNSDFSITSNAWQKQTIELAPGKAKLFYDHKKHPYGSVFFDSYKEVYNWKHEWFHYKFIVNNYENFTASIPEYLQPNQDHPMILINKNKVVPDRSKNLAIDKGENDFDIWEEVINRWGTLKTTIRLRNPEYNIISADLRTFWKYYKNCEEIAPFINQLYFYNQLHGLINESKSLPNHTGEDVNQRNIDGIKLRLGNFLDNLRRKRKFKRAKKRMPDKPIILAEGDSWFLYPFLIKDIIDYVMKEFPVRSIASAGDELENYKKDGQLLKVVSKIHPRYVLISGGGNDIIGSEIQHILHTNIDPGKEPQAYLNSNFNKNMTQLKKLYEYFILKLKKQHSVKQVFLHGYDYIRTDHEASIIDKGWVNKHMQAKGINAAKDRYKVIKHLIDTFNKILIDLSKEDPFVTYLDLRNQVQKEQWKDEIHPDNIGFKTLGNIFIDAIHTFHKNSLL